MTPRIGDASRDARLRELQSPIVRPARVVPAAASSSTTTESCDCGACVDGVALEGATICCRGHGVLTFTSAVWGTVTLRHVSGTDTWESDPFTWVCDAGESKVKWLLTVSKTANSTLAISTVVDGGCGLVIEYVLCCPFDCQCDNQFTICGGRYSGISRELLDDTLCVTPDGGADHCSACSDSAGDIKATIGAIGSCQEIFASATCDVIAEAGGREITLRPFQVFGCEPVAPASESRPCEWRSDIFDFSQSIPRACLIPSAFGSWDRFVYIVSRSPLVSGYINCTLYGVREGSTPDLCLTTLGSTGDLLLTWTSEDWDCYESLELPLQAPAASQICPDAEPVTLEFQAAALPRDSGDCSVTADDNDQTGTTVCQETHGPCTIEWNDAGSRWEVVTANGCVSTVTGDCPVVGGSQTSCGCRHPGRDGDFDGETLIVSCGCCDGQNSGVCETNA